MNKQPGILLVEDNEGDVELIIEAFKNFKVNLDMSVVNNGEEAILYLGLKTKQSIEQKPNLILRDINLPKANGKEVLHCMKTGDVLKTIPVEMLTSSSLQNNIYYAYNNQANYYIKPGNPEESINVIHNIESFWLDCVNLS